MSQNATHIGEPQGQQSLKIKSKDKGSPSTGRSKSTLMDLFEIWTDLFYSLFSIYFVFVFLNAYWCMWMNTNEYLSYSVNDGKLWQDGPPDSFFFGQVHWLIDKDLQDFLHRGNWLLERLKICALVISKYIL